MSSDLAALKEYMQHPPPDGDQDNGPILLGVTWAFTAICTVVVGLKLWTRFKIIGQTGMDDAFTVLALVCIPYLNEPPCTKLITDWQAFPSGIRSAFDRQPACIPSLRPFIRNLGRSLHLDLDHENRFSFRRDIITHIRDDIALPRSYREIRGLARRLYLVRGTSMNEAKLTWKAGPPRWKRGKDLQLTHLLRQV
ncbi:MAG: hypothetical protein LQ352_003354 [Teloschistes flavicans]|nr:MAG: hypothetical protein LQ352_003354 [Teloschistes flavicans]